jgi:hypothetical protein
MLRWLISITLVSAASLAILIGLAAEFSTRYIVPESIALQPVGCPQPCWDGVQPGHSRVQDALLILNANPLVVDLIRNDPNPVFPCELEWKMVTIPIFTGCMVIRPDQPVDTIILRFEDEQIRLGDVIDLYGMPVAAELCHRFDFGIRFRNNVFGTLYFPNHIIIAAYNQEPDQWRLTPTMFVKMIRYTQADTVPAQAPRWEGFKSTYAYGTTCSY